MPGEFRCAISAVCGVALAALLILPESSWGALPVLCPFRNLFGIECFGCGMTRALSAALHGHIARAMQQNAGVALVLPALLAGVVQGVLVRR